MITTSQLNNHQSIATRENLSISELFKKLTDTRELAKELNPLFGPSSHSEAYASMMLTAGLDENTEKKVFNWILDLLTINEDWPSKWDQTRFDEAFSHLNFNQKFALLAGMYRLAKLGENHEAIKQHCQKAATIFKSYLFNLIHLNPVDYQKLDLSNSFSLKNSTAFRFDQTALSSDFLTIISKHSNAVPQEILKEDLSINDKKISSYIKATLATTLLASGAAATTYLLKSFRAKRLPPPPESFFDLTKKFVNDHSNIFSYGIAALVASYIIYAIHQVNTENKHFQYHLMAIYALNNIETLKIDDLHDKSSVVLYITALKKFIHKLKDQEGLDDWKDILNKKQQSIPTQPLGNKIKSLKEKIRSLSDLEKFVNLLKELEQSLPQNQRFFSNLTV